MKKRIVCVLLTLIMLLSLIPMGASAASNKVSEAAITVLKQMTTLKTVCYHYSGSEFRTGYGTVCGAEAGDDGSGTQQPELCGQHPDLLCRCESGLGKESQGGKYAACCGDRGHLGVGRLTENRKFVTVSLLYL